MSKLRLSNVTKSFAAVRALGPISIEVSTGEFLTLLGPSGSGKTTLLNILAGLLQPDSGEVWIDAKLATYAPAYARDIGMVFQNYALFPHLTVSENISFPLQMRGVESGEIARRVKKILEIVHLPDVGDRLPKQLSGGQQQRIALARSAVYEPSIILMDEPLGALDKKLRDSMQLEIIRIHKELGATILYVTHDQEEALAMSDRICLMNAGTIEQLADPQTLYFRPNSIFAADFMGGANLLPARDLQCKDGHVEFTGPEGIRVIATAPETVASQVSANTFMVRPEQIRLLVGNERADNEVIVRVDNLVISGPITRCYSRMPGDTRLVSILLTRSDPSGLRPGQDVRLGWSAADTVMLRGGWDTEPQNGAV